MQFSILLLASTFHHGEVGDSNCSMPGNYWLYVCCLDSSKIPPVLCLTPKLSIFGGSYTGVAAFLEGLIT